MTHFKFPDTRLLVFAKAPIQGKVKTRLIPDIGEKAATDFYRDMASTIIDRFVKSQLCPIELCCYPDTNHSFFKNKTQRYSVGLVSQTGSSLGDRMLNAVSSSIQHGTKHIVVGTDCLEYTATYLESAIIALDSHDIVVGPANDGGFVLIGMKKVFPDIFNGVFWGGQHVMKVTETNLKKMNLSYKLLTPLNDVDTIEDMQTISDIEPYKK